MMWRGGWTGFVRRNQFILYGAPFLASISIGAYAFSWITQIRYDAADKKTESLTKNLKLGLKADRKVKTIQEVYFDLMKNREDVNFEDWEYVRVKRPDEEEDPYWKKE